MKSFAATAAIGATADRIWAILVDAARYPSWNPTVSQVDGRIAPGERIALHVTLNPGRACPVTVATFEPSRR
ncbi:MAG: SRPBCC family protein, partial [Vicinamibacterales bacterium]